LEQLVGIKVIQSPNVIITTVGVETMVAPNTNVVRGGVLIGSVANLGSGLNGVLVGRKECKSKFNITNDNYWSCWCTTYGVYQFDNDYSCE